MTQFLFFLHPLYHSKKTVSEALGAAAKTRIGNRTPAARTTTARTASKKIGKLALTITIMVHMQKLQL